MTPKTAGQLRACMPADSRRRSTAHAMRLFAATLTCYLATLAAIVVAPGWLSGFCLSLVAGFLIGVLFVIGHDACHGAFTDRPWLNAVLGRLAFLPSWHPYSGWEHAHNRVHHAWTNLRHKDYAWAPLSKEDYDALSCFGRWRERRYRSLFGFGIYYFIEVYCKRTLWPSRSFRGKTNMFRLASDNGLVLAFIGLQSACLAAAVTWLNASSRVAEVLVFGQWLPFLLFNWMLGFLIFLHHTHPQIPWFDRVEDWSFYAGQIRGTAHVVFPGSLNGLIQHIMEHTAHHADPRVPLYKLHAAQAALERVFPEDLIVHRFTWRSFSYTLQVCQLYDYRNRCWMSFAGVPTSSCNLPDFSRTPGEEAASASSFAASRTAD